MDEGRGEPVVFVHGGLGWSYCFRSLIQALAQARRALAPDHRGCGLSDKPEDASCDDFLKTRADDLEALLESLGIKEKITLVLHGWGGAVGMAYAARAPQRLGRLVILNSAAFPPPPGKTLPWWMRACRGALGPLLVQGLNALAPAAVDRACARPLKPEVRQAYLAPYASGPGRAALLGFIRDVPLSPQDRSYDPLIRVQDGLHRFRDIPALICWGGRDFFFDEDFLRVWIRQLPKAEVCRFQDAGHFVLEDAGEEIIPLVRRFLERHPA